MCSVSAALQSAASQRDACPVIFIAVTRRYAAGAISVMQHRIYARKADTIPSAPWHTEWQMPSKPPQPENAPTAKQPERARPANVLVVDDDPGVLLLLEETLAEAGFDVMSACTGEEALEACKDLQPDLALLDINMPGMDGIETCGKIRQRCGDGFPIIMVTSVDDAMSIQSAFEAGASDFILKPINWPLFQRRMEHIIGEWRHAAELDESNKRLEALQRVAPEQVMLVSRNGVIIEDLKERSGHAAANTVRVFPTLDELYGPEVSMRFKQCISAAIKTRKSKTLRFTANQWGMQCDCEADFQVDGRDRVIVVVQSIDEQQDYPSEEIYRLAFFDERTGLPNQHLFRRIAGNKCAEAMLSSQSMAVFSVGVTVSDIRELDLDALRAFEDRLTARLAEEPNIVAVGDRKSARPFAHGGDLEYLMLLDDVRSTDDIRRLLEAVRDAAAASSSLEIATGVSILPSDGSRLEMLIAAARGARMEAQIDGQPACFHSSEAGVPVVKTVDHVQELREAIDKGQLALHFQPRLELASGRIASVEALLRWNHPMRGYVRLAELLPLAKATGVIFEIGDWVLRTACETAEGWPGGMDAPKVSVNLSRQELVRDGLVGGLRDVINATGLDPARLELEITESALLRARDAVRLLSRIRSLGVGLVLDDFGTGFSSLGSLKDYPIDGLKIDASFVRGSTRDSADASICEVIIMMAHKMGLKAIAEAVESERELAFLTKAGCDEVQGYVVSEPLPAHRISEFLEEALAVRQN